MRGKDGGRSANEIYTWAIGCEEDYVKRARTADAGAGARLKATLHTIPHSNPPQMSLIVLRRCNVAMCIVDVERNDEVVAQIQRLHSESSLTFSRQRPHATGTQLAFGLLLGLRSRNKHPKDGRT